MCFGMLRNLGGREMVFLRILSRYDIMFCLHVAVYPWKGLEKNSDVGVQVQGMSEYYINGQLADHMAPKAN